MKKGIILYVTEGKEEMQPDRLNLKEPLGLLSVDAISLATSEEEISYSWWRFITRGIQQISCMKATYDAVGERLEPFGIPFRLCG